MSDNVTIQVDNLHVNRDYSSRFSEGESVQLLFLGDDPRIHALVVQPIRVEDAKVVGFYVPHNDGCYVFRTASGVVCHIEPFSYPYQPDKVWGPYGSPQVSGNWADWFMEDGDRMPPSVRMFGNYCLAPGKADSAYLGREALYEHTGSMTIRLLPRHDADPSLCGAVIVLPKQPLEEGYFTPDKLAAEREEAEGLLAIRSRPSGPAYKNLVDGTQHADWEDLSTGDVVRIEDRFGNLENHRIIIKGHKDNVGERWDRHMLTVSEKDEVHIVERGYATYADGTGIGSNWTFNDCVNNIRLGKVASGKVQDVRMTVRTAAGVLPMNCDFEAADAEALTAALVTGADVWIDVDYAFDDHRQDVRRVSFKRYEIL